MHLSDLRPVPGSVHKKKRLGRGNASGKGTTGGRGTKGQQSRTGPDLRIHFEGGQMPLVRGLSRLRGFNNKWRVEYEPINLAEIAGLATNSVVTPETLRAVGIVKSASKPVKILGDGEISVALDITADRFSASARAKIEAAGGKVTERNPKVVDEGTAKGKRAARRRAGAAEAASHTARAEAAPAPEAPAAEAPRRTRSRAAATPEAEAETPAAAESNEEEAED
jgi:large subunit ribosomal protein L15